MYFVKHYILNVLNNVHLYVVIIKKEKEDTNMGFDLSALFEGFDIVAVVQGLIKLVTDLIGGFLA